MYIEDIDTSKEVKDFLREMGYKEIPDITYSELFFIDLIYEVYKRSTQYTKDVAAQTNPYD